jgi:DNA polymerase-3 subunit epsilon
VKGKFMRQVVLDTETTGLDWERGHRMIEIGCVELVNRRQTGVTWQQYLNPQREIDDAAYEVHGLSSKDLADKPLFPDVAAGFLEFVAGAELIIHNAPFDVGFLDNELQLADLESSSIGRANQILDTLILARQIHPGQRNSLDALCKRYSIDNSRRDLHGALLDARLLAEVYLAMTGGQGALSLGDTAGDAQRSSGNTVNPVDRHGIDLEVIRASAADIAAHEAQLDLIDDSCEDGPVWRRAEP